MTCGAVVDLIPNYRGGVTVETSTAEDNVVNTCSVWPSSISVGYSAARVVDVEIGSKSVCE